MTTINKRTNDVSEESISKKSKIDDGNELVEILDLNFKWPSVFVGGKSAKRYLSKKDDIPFKDIHDILRSMGTSKSIAIDGMNGCGKSTTVNRMSKRIAIKVNNFCPETTKGSLYNIDPIRSMDYMFFQIAAKKDEYIVWDRSCLSNLIFYLVHFLMAYYNDNPIPHKFSEVQPLIYTWFVNNSMDKAIRMILAMDQHTKKIFLINSDLDMVGKMLLLRGEPNDVFNASKPNYQLAQMHAFKFFGQLSSDILCIDIADFIRNGHSIDYISNLLISYLNADLPIQETKDMKPDVERGSVINIINYFNYNDDTLLSFFSNK